MTAELSDRAVARVLEHVVALVTREVERERELKWVDGARTVRNVAVEAPSRAIAAGRCLQLRLVGRQWAALLVRDHAVSRPRVFETLAELRAALDRLGGASDAFVGALAVQALVNPRSVIVALHRGSDATADAAAVDSAAFDRLGALTLCVFGTDNPGDAAWTRTFVGALAARVAPRVADCELVVVEHTAAEVEALPLAAFTCTKLVKNTPASMSLARVVQRGAAGRMRRLWEWGVYFDVPIGGSLAGDGDAAQPRFTSAEDERAWIATRYPHVTVTSNSSGERWCSQGDEVAIDCEAYTARRMAEVAGEGSPHATTLLYALIKRSPHVRVELVCALAMRQNLGPPLNLALARLCTHGLDLLAPLPWFARFNYPGSLPLFVAAHGLAVGLGPLLALLAPGRLAGTAADGQSWLWHAASSGLRTLVNACVSDGARATVSELERAAVKGYGLLFDAVASRAGGGLGLAADEHARVRAAWLAHRHRYEHRHDDAIISSYFPAQRQ